MKSAAMAFLAAAVVLVPLVASGDGDGAGIQVSPGVIVLRSKSVGDSLTVHANVAFGIVDTETVVLKVNGSTILPQATFPDLGGELVAKFSLQTIKPLVAPPSADLTLECETLGGPFSATSTVRVIAN